MRNGMTAAGGDAGKPAARGLTVAAARGQARVMSPENAAPKRKLPLVKLGLAAVVAAVVAVLALRGVDGSALAERGMNLIRSAGPVAFFSALAILPALGAPVMPFHLTAGAAFAGELGMPLVVALTLAAVTVNFMVTYALARGALRPLLEKLLARFGYRLPAMDAGDVTDLAIVVRVTPGIPFVVQNYLLGLARVPLGKYVLVSCIVCWIYAAAAVLFGDALLHGRGRRALLTGCLLVMAVVAAHWTHKHYAKKNRGAEAPSTKPQAPEKGQ